MLVARGGTQDGVPGRGDQPLWCVVRQLGEVVGQRPPDRDGLVDPSGGEQHLGMPALREEGEAGGSAPDFRLDLLQPDTGPDGEA